MFTIGEKSWPFTLHFPADYPTNTLNVKFVSCSFLHLPYLEILFFYFIFNLKFDNGSLYHHLQKINLQHG